MTDLRHRILLVDDDLLLRQFAAGVLSEEYELMQAVDGQDAWEKAQVFRPELVITDLMMPRMHGFELCGRLKGPEGIKGVRVLIVSAKSFPVDQAQAETAGADAYIVKPYNADMLRAQVRALLSGVPSPAAPAAPPAAPAAETFSARVPQPIFGFAGRPPLYVKFWGTRGSCPTGGVKTMRYGGNTACIEVRVGDLVLIMDCGTGLRELGNSLTREFRDRPIEAHVLVGHTHWDHLSLIHI